MLSQESRHRAPNFVAVATYTTTTNVNFKIIMSETIISIGNGGYNVAAGLIAAYTFPDARVIVCDTDADSLERNSSIADESFLLEKLQKDVKSDDVELVNDVVGKATDNVIICATLGGMTGSKYAPLVALNARLQGKFVSAFFTMPSAFEGQQVNKRAAVARQQLIAASNVAVQQNNERVKEIDTLGLDDMDKPLIDTVVSALNGNSLEELPKVSDNDVVPEACRIDGMPVVSIIGDAYPGISADRMKELFDNIGL